MTGRYAVRDQLAAALGDAWQRGVFFVVDNPGTVSSPTRVDFGLYADALLPVVDRIANQRAAAMLRAAADWIWDDVPALASASAELHARADHLDPS